MKARSPSKLAVALLAVSVALALSGTWLSIHLSDVSPPPGWRALASPAFLWLVLGFSGVGALVAMKRRDHPIGWLLLGAGILWQLEHVAGDLRVLLAVERPDLPGAAASAWAFDVLWIAPVCLVPLIVLLFPTGRLPAPRWRPVLAALGVASGALFVAVGLRPGPFTNTPGTNNPLGITGLEGVIEPLEAIGNLLVAASFIAALASLAVRRQSGDVETRQQLKWIIVAMVGIVLAYMAAGVLEASGTDAGTLGIVRTVPLVLLPSACGIAIISHQLFDIDLVISKLFVYSGLTAGIIAVYVTVVVGVGTLLGASDEPNLGLAVVAMAGVALAFEPARRFMQRIADRAVYGRRATPYDALASMTRTVSGDHDPDDVLQRMAMAIAEATGGRAEVWLADADGLRRSASWPGLTDDPGSEPLPLGAPILIHGADATFPVRRGTTVLGALTVTKPRGEMVTRAEQRLLADLADSAAFVLDNARLVEDLRSSRQRLVAAQDSERRRVERNLHDGAQQRLLELALTLRRAERQVAINGSGDAKESLRDANAQLAGALSELRDLARGIHPAILTEQGLAAALGSMAARLPMRAHLELAVDRRLSSAVESTAYFVVSEAIANVVKHAGDASLRITACHGERGLRVEVADDGAGGADATGAGLQGLSDRVAALGGRFEIDSPPGGGTRVVAVLPCG